MEKWRQFLKKWGPRQDAREHFYPEKVETEKPVLLNSMAPMTAAFVGARVLRALVARGGTRFKPSALEKLEGLVAHALPEDVVHHCEAEVERILEWMETPPSIEDPGVEASSKAPELDIMIAADLESRLSVAHFALSEDFDLELEYFDEETQSWPRIRAILDGLEGGDAADFETALQLRYRGEELVVPLKYVRWLMPIPPLSSEEAQEPPGADVLDFPGPSRDS